MRADLDGIDFEFVRRLLRFRPDVSGIATGWMEARGNIDHVHCSGRLAVSGGVFNGLEFDSLGVAVTSDADGTELRDLQLVTPHGALRGHLRIGLLPSLGRWFGPGPVPQQARTDVDAATIDGEFRFADLDLDRLWQARGTGTLPPRWSARLSSQLAISGTLGAPRLDMQGMANRIHITPVTVDSLAFDVAYADENLVLRKLDLNTEGQVLHAEGRVPARLHWRHSPQLLRDRPLEGVAVLPHSSFAIVEHFLPMFEPPPVSLPRGEVEGRLQAQGTLQALKLDGGFRVTKASFMLRDMEEVFRDVDAVGTFSGNKLVITELHGATGSKGRITGSGDVDLSGLRLTGYNFKLDLQEVTIRSVPDITAVVNGHEVKIQGHEVGNRLIPEISGNVDVLRGEIRQEFSSEGGAEPIFATDVPPLYLNLTLRADRGDVWIRNSIVDAELEGNLTVTLDERGLGTEGEVRVRRGTYSYLVNRFDITRGVLDFSRGSGFNPQLDIEGQSGRPGERNYITLRGTATEPQLSFRSDRSDRSSDEIQQDLFTAEGDRDQAAATAIADFAEQTLRDLRALPSFSIDPALKEGSGPATNATNAYSYNVSAGTEISNRVWLVYTQGVNSDLGQRVAIEVDINRWLLLGSSYERRDVTTTGLNQPQNAYDINLKYRHEY
jgi:autotransporter translocation and assembly factor TamB